MFSLENKKKNEYLKIKVDRDYVFGENLKSILVKLYDKHDTQFFIWFNKNNVFYSNYTNKLSISLIDADDYMYNVYKYQNSDWKRPDGTYRGKDLYNALNDLYKVENKNAQ